MLPKIREFLGQRFAASGAIDFSLYALLGTSLVLTSVLTWADFQDSAQTIAIILANVFAVGTLYLLIVLTGLALKARGRNLSYSLGLLIAIGLVLGGLKGFLTWFGMELGGRDQEIAADLWGRILFSALTGLVFIPVVALFSSLRFRYVEQRELLIGEEIARAGGNSYPETLMRFINETKERLKSHASTLQRSSLVSELRDIVNSDLRPLSQKIWAQESLRFPSFRLSQIAKVAIFKHVYSVYWVVPIWGITSGAATIRLFGLEEGISIQLARVLVLFLGLWVAGRVRVRSFPTALVLYLGTIVLIAVSQFALGTAIAGSREFGLELGFIAANLIWLIQLTMLIGMAKAFIEMGNRVETEYQKFLSNSDLDEIRNYRESGMRDRQVAQFLHGHIQTRLNGVAKKIESRPRNIEIAEDLDEIEAVLNAALSEFGKRQASQIEEVVEGLQRDWGGFAELYFAVNPINFEEDQLATIKEVISEGIANAVRHGLATKVSIFVAEGPLLTIIDDGTGPRNGKPGLGSTYFTSVSSSWSITSTGAGSKLMVRLTQAES